MDLSRVSIVLEGMGRIAAIAGLTLLLIFGCGSDDDAAGSWPIQLLPLHAEPDPVRGGAIVDSAGRQVLLRGVNVNAFAEYWSSRDFPTTFPFEETDAEMIAGIGWNAVRLLLSWSRVEPAPGQYDDAYLDEIEDAVATLARHGVYTILDLHQDAWGPTLAARPDENCGDGQEPAFGWDGAPGWATLDDGLPRCTTAGLRESSPAVRRAWEAFFGFEIGPGDVPVHTRYMEMLAHVAGRFASNAAVAGIDLMNEPNAFTAADMFGLASLYAGSWARIRQAEREAGGFPHLILFEPSAIWSAVGQGPPPSFEHDDDFVYAPHIYTGGFDNGPISASAFQVACDEAALFEGVPVLTGEWGSDPRRASDPNDPYFLEHQRLQDEFQFGATLWTWRESCGDPHKAGDYRAGRIPMVWGEFEVDCRTNEIVGRRGDLIDQLTRPLVRAAPGRIDSIEYDPVSGDFAVGGSTEVTGAELVVFYPAAKHGAPAAETSGLGELKRSAAPAGGTYLHAATAGRTWSLELTGAP